MQIEKIKYARVEFPSKFLKIWMFIIITLVCWKLECISINLTCKQGFLLIRVWDIVRLSTVRPPVRKELYILLDERLRTQNT